MSDAANSSIASQRELTAWRSLVNRSFTAWEGIFPTEDPNRDDLISRALLGQWNSLDDFLAHAGAPSMFWFFQLRKAFMSAGATVSLSAISGKRKTIQIQMGRSYVCISSNCLGKSGSISGLTGRVCLKTPDRISKKHIPSLPTDCVGDYQKLRLYVLLSTV